MKWKKDEAQNRKIETLVSEVRSAASESTDALWNAFLEIGDLDMVRAMEKALRLLVSHGDYIEAMKVLEGIYALVEMAPSEDFTDCQQHSALAQMFMEEYLAKSEDFIFDTGMDDVLALLTSEKPQIPSGLSAHLHSGCAATSAAYGYDYN